jgi:mono/diheme cytochrome c family protein
MTFKQLVTSTVLVTVLGAGAHFLAACEQEAPPPSNAVPPAVPEPRVELPPGPPAPLSKDEFARAQTLFNARCASCHLESGTGDPHHRKDQIPDFSDVSWQRGRTDDALTSSIANGLGTVMPSFGAKLSSDDIALLVGYVREVPGRAQSNGSDGPHQGASRNKATRTSPGKTPDVAPKANGGHSGHSEHP